MKSCLYRGTLVHQRREPCEHRFRYPIFMLYLDLDELPRLFDPFWLWSARRPALAWFRRGDHVGDPSEPLIDSVRGLVARALGTAPGGPVRLLTHLRYFGHTFNPASFYFCFDASDSRVDAVVVEVHNTPWKERHCYVVPNPEHNGTALGGSADKAFHVSPFMPMDMTYHWKLGQPGERLALGIRNSADGRVVHDAQLALKREPLCSATLAMALLRFPLHTLQIVWRIHWQAFRLWRKGVSVHTHPNKNTKIKEKPTV
ncbi:MAG: DUF1365 domain-containing protein [Pseudomonadota bacterium]